MTSINARTKSVRQLLSSVKYTIDFYQRDYAWERRHVRELIDDLAGRFLASYDPRDERAAVQDYPHYFLGTIVIASDRGQTVIIDGQQRLTTLTLMLIWLNHQRETAPDIPDVRPLIFSESFGRRAFNIDIPERADIMRSLYERSLYERSLYERSLDEQDADDALNGDAAQRPPSTEVSDLSARNLLARYADLCTLLPKALPYEALPYFTDWLVENVDLVEIETYSADDAFTIFETMNDRGMTLGPAAMLKGYLLANISGDKQKAYANDLWRQRAGELAALDRDAEADFFRTWLRARFARSIRDPKRGAPARDYEHIHRFHRWVRDERQRIGLHRHADFYDFVARQLNRYAQVYVRLRQAALHFTPGLEALYYNAHLGLSGQYLVLLAALRPADDAATLERKIALVMTYLDIDLARRLVNFRPTAPAALVYPQFALAREIRELSADELAVLLRLKLETMPETFEAVDSYHLTAGNRRAVHYVLARLTYAIEQASGLPTYFPTYIARDLKRPFEIEHLWPDKFGRHVDDFPYPDDFSRAREQLGALVLLPRGFNQSFGALPYEEKVEHYRSQNLLAWSLHPSAYQHNPGFLQFIQASGLPFRPHTEFTLEDLDARQRLLRRLCEWVWSPERLSNTHSSI